MHHPFSPFLEAKGLVIIDGALATELERRGADLGDALWSARLLVDAPELIRAVHLDYLRAGANVLITASYQASVAGFRRRGLDEAQVADLFRLSVRLAAEAIEEYLATFPYVERALRPLIAASIGPYGAYLADGSEYRGDYGLSVDALMAWHRPRMAALACSAVLGFYVGIRRILSGGSASGRRVGSDRGRRGQLHRAAPCRVTPDRCTRRHAQAFAVLPQPRRNVGRDRA